MVKHSPSRNHRSKGIKGTHILQIGVLLAVCFWLIYQVKHSHDKKKAFDEHDAKISQTTHVPNEILKFGRKYLQPRLEETIMKNEKHDEEEVEVEEEETGGEEEENKHEDEEQEDSKTEERDDEGREGGDNEIDENDQEKLEIEAERDEEFIDEEKDREEGDEKETEEKDSKDKEGRNENEKETEEKDSEDKKGQNEKEAEEKDSRDGGNRSAHEAREENYKGDDASSAVTHDTEAITTETERGSVDNSKEDTDMDGQEEESKSNDTMSSEAEKGENGTSPNSPTLNKELGNNSTEQHLDVHNILLQNGTETKPDATKAQIGGTATVDLIATIGESSNSSTTTDFTLSEKVKTSNASVGVEGQSESLAKEGNADGTQIEKTEASNRTDKIQDLSETGDTDEVHHDSIDSSDSSIPLEGKDISTDLDTVLEIRNEGSNNEDAAAE
ncbi:hypothetical protein Acr_06g0014290 [Actinidia rufa]|uniref:Uncharacterized protein n=1 Tax=Actinidia rufa TaxID=165716 RepID=A0A7J0EU49_9ERIC|nr:hypothetical protein Acr_06g0014290 [Actinidia rufa]